MGNGKPTATFKGSKGLGLALAGRVTGIMRNHRIHRTSSVPLLGALLATLCGIMAHSH